MSGIEEKLVTVIIPYFNRLKLLPRAILSAVAQTHRNLEIIVVDDASEQDPREVLAGIDDPRIRYIRHERNRGVSVARNTGLAAAKGKYVSFLDSDDEYLPNKIEKQLLAIERAGPGKVCYCFSEIVSDTSGEVLKVHSYEGEGDILHPVLMGSKGTRGWTGLVVLMNEMMLAKDDLLSVGGFDEKYRMHEDWELLIRLAQRYEFVCVKEILVRGHKHRHGHIGDRYQHIPHVRYLMWEAHKVPFLKDREASAFFFSELGYYEGINGMRGRAVLSLARSVACRPARTDPYLKMLLLFTNGMEKPKKYW